MARSADAQDRRRFALLLGTVVMCVAVQGVVSPGGAQQFVATALLGASLVLSLEVAHVRRSWRWIALGLAGVALIVSLVDWAAGTFSDGWLRLLAASLVLLSPSAVAVGVVRNLRRHRAVRLEAVMGALTLYLLLGLLFAAVYGVVDRLGGDPFFAGGQAATLANCQYFSFTTLATVGYGDLTARTDLGHTLSILEALFGQIYLVTVVSMIISNLGRSDRPRRPQRDD